MGGGSSKVNQKILIDNFYSRTVEQFTDIMDTAISQTNARMDSYQEINIDGLQCLGKLTMKNISQQAKMSLDMEVISEHFNEIDLDSKIETVLESIVQSDQDIKTELGAPGADQDTVMRDFSESVEIFRTQITKETFNEVFAKIDNFQSLSAKGTLVIGDCNFSNLSQNFWSELAVRNISSEMTSVFSKIVSENNQKRTQKSSQAFEGEGWASLVSTIGTYIIIIAIIIVVIIAMGIGAFLLVKFGAFL